MRRFWGLLIVFAGLFVAVDASAQIHYDASLEAGAMKRFLADRAGAHDAGFGPTAQFAAHLALLPLVYVGGYLGNDISPVSGGGTRDITFGGLHVKGFIPVFPKSMRGWIYAGFGYSGVYEQSHRPEPAGTGGFFDVPFGLGASYMFWKPWSVFAELGGRAGFGFHGDAYERADKTNSVDRFGTNLSLGIMIDL